MKKNIQIIIFLFLNIFLSPIITVHFISLYWGGLIMMEEPYKINEIFLWIIFSIFLLRVLLFPFFYRINKDNFLCEYFIKIKNDKNFATKILIVSFLIDFISVSFFNIILAISENINLNLTDFFIMFLFPYIFGGYGLFFAYLSLIVWIRLVSQKFKTISAFNLLLLIIFIIMSAPFLILTIWIFVMLLISIFKV